MLITTSGIGSRLGAVTKFTNKSLVPLGDKPVISRIIEQYPTETEFVVTLGHFGDQVRDFLNLAYPNTTFHFVDVDNYSGPGSSLAHSMLQAKSLLMEPFIFNASDTIVSQKVNVSDKNWIGGFSGQSAAEYSSFDTFEGKAVQIHPKGMDFFDFIYIGLANIFDFEDFWSNLDLLYTENPQDDSLNDLSAIGKMIDTKIPFEFVEFKNWIDTGNVRSFMTAQQESFTSLKTLPKNDESIFLIEDKVVKFFSNVDSCSNRVKRATVLEGLVPKILDVKPNFYSYDFIPGEVASKVMDIPLFEKFLDFCKTELWLENTDKVSDSEFNKVCHEFYFSKTRMRVTDFFTKTGLKDREEKINGEVVPSITKLLALAEEEKINLGEQKRIHGDLILDNIIVESESFKLIDWRQDFSGLIHTGDVYYDYAKLNHSLVLNHEIILANEFKIDERRDDIFIDVHRSENLVQCQLVLRNYLAEMGVNLRKLDILTSIVWINMSPLHIHPLDKFLFYFGKFNLMKAMSHVPA